MLLPTHLRRSSNGNVLEVLRGYSLYSLPSQFLEMLGSEVLVLTPANNKGVQYMFEKFQQKFGEGTSFDLDYGKLLIIGLLVYHIFFQNVH